jgi:hypothetical protein
MSLPQTNHATITADYASLFQQFTMRYIILHSNKLITRHKADSRNNALHYITQQQTDYKTQG